MLVTLKVSDHEHLPEEARRLVEKHSQAQRGNSTVKHLIHIKYAMRAQQIAGEYVGAQETTD